jgi:hypothetical protein
MDHVFAEVKEPATQLDNVCLVVVSKKHCDNDFKDPFGVFDPLSFFSKPEDEEGDLMLLEPHEAILDHEDGDEDKLEYEAGPSNPEATRLITSVVASISGSYFLPLDPDIFEFFYNLDTGKSVKNEKWAASHFNSWRKDEKIGCSLKIEELPLEVLADLFTKFFLCLCKKNGDRYPSGSIGNIYGSFHKIVGRQQGTVKVGVPKKVVFTKISAYVSVSNKSIS